MHPANHRACSQTPALCHASQIKIHVSPSDLSRQPVAPALFQFGAIPGEHLHDLVERFGSTSPEAEKKTICSAALTTPGDPEFTIPDGTDNDMIAARRPGPAFIGPASWRLCFIGKAISGKRFPDRPLRHIQIHRKEELMKIEHVYPQPISNGAAAKSTRDVRRIITAARRKGYHPARRPRTPVPSFDYIPDRCYQALAPSIDLDGP